jgi:hypothetical protein
LASIVPLSVAVEEETDEALSVVTIGVDARVLPVETEPEAVVLVEVVLVT